MLFANVLNVILGSLGIVAIGGSIVLWVISLYQAITRKDLENNKWLWILLIIFVCPIGTIAYFFMEKKKKLGIWYLVSFLSFPVILTIYAISKFVMASLY